MIDYTNTQDKNGVFFDPEIHALNKKGEPLKYFGRFVLKEKAPSVEVGEVLKNPELEPAKIATAEVEGNLSQEQKKAIYIAEAEEKILKEQAEREARQKFEIAMKKAREVNQYKLDYNIEEFKQWATETAARSGCKFQLDSNENGLIGTYHIWGRGKIDCGNIHQPEETLKRNITVFCGTPTSVEMERTTIRNQLDGSMMNIPVTNLAAMAQQTYAKDYNENVYFDIS